MILCDRSRALQGRFRRWSEVREQGREPELNTEQHPRDDPSGSSRVAFDGVAFKPVVFKPVVFKPVAFKFVTRQTRRTSGISHSKCVTPQSSRTSILSHCNLVALQSCRTQWGGRTRSAPCVNDGSTRRLIAGIARGIATSRRGVEVSGLPSKASSLTPQASRLKPHASSLTPHASSLKRTHLKSSTSTPSARIFSTSKLIFASASLRRFAASVRPS